MRLMFWKFRSTHARDERGDSLALLVLWPVLIVAVLVMLVHAFIVTNARAEAEFAASQGLRAAWRAAAASDFGADPDNPREPYTDAAVHPQVYEMTAAAGDAVAAAAAVPGGWRWWTPNAAQVHSDWCGPSPDAPGVLRPQSGQTGWTRVIVSGEVFGPLAALWPDRWDRVYASAEGPAVLRSSVADRNFTVPLELPEC